MRSTIGIARCCASIESTIAVSDPTLETGGALFGHERPLRITSAAGPGPNAIHQPQYFLRDLEYTQRAADRAYALDRSQWLGEWHTHPHGPSGPSTLDLTTYANHLGDAELRFECFITLIWSTATSSRVSAWSLTRSLHGVELRSGLLTVEEADHDASGPAESPTS